MLPLRARVHLGARAMKEYSAFPKAPALVELHHQIVLCHIQDTRREVGVLPLRRGEVGVFYWATNGLRDQSSIPGRVISKTQNMVFNASLLNTQHYKVHIKGKWSNPVKGVMPSPTHQCNSY